MKHWIITINGVRFEVDATNAWTATTRAIKGYWKYRGKLSALKDMTIHVSEAQQ